MELEVSDKNRGNASSHVYTILKNNCSVCKKNKKKAYLMCRETCDYQICYGCMSIQLHKALSLSNYDIAWEGHENEEIVIGDNNDIGGTTWQCPHCEETNVISENELMMCAKAKKQRDDALAILKG
tara:strand:- start:150 stop:527 length:378 start_codon:yes stop_codon:yes gene_type:complete